MTGQSAAEALEAWRRVGEALRALMDSAVEALLPKADPETIEDPDAPCCGQPDTCQSTICYLKPWMRHPQRVHSGEATKNTGCGCDDTEGCDLCQPFQFTEPTSGPVPGYRLVSRLEAPQLAPPHLWGGNCGRCGEVFRAGDLVEGPGAFWRHVTCPAAATRPAEAAEPEHQVPLSEYLRVCVDRDVALRQRIDAESARRQLLDGRDEAHLRTLLGRLGVALRCPFAADVTDPDSIAWLGHLVRHAEGNPGPHGVTDPNGELQQAEDELTQAVTDHLNQTNPPHAYLVANADMQQSWFADRETASAEAAAAQRRGFEYARVAEVRWAK